MSNEQLLKDLIEWFQIMCSLDMQSEADELLFNESSIGAPPELDAWANFRILTNDIQGAIQERQQVSALEE